MAFNPDKTPHWVKVKVEPPYAPTELAKASCQFCEFVASARTWKSGSASLTAHQDATGHNWNRLQ
jgi:hypothetical protein